MSEMLDDLDPEDAYQAYIERKRAQATEQPDLTVRPTFSEQDANVILDVLYAARPRYSAESQMKIDLVLSKVERALTVAREEGGVMPDITRA